MSFDWTREVERVLLLQRGNTHVAIGKFFMFADAKLEKKEKEKEEKKTKKGEKKRKRKKERKERIRNSILFSVEREVRSTAARTTLSDSSNKKREHQPEFVNVDDGL
jgi:hypothetical protein